MTNILVIEDNPDNSALFEEILEDEGYAVYKAFRAEDGLEQIKTTPIDLILMDLSLPEMGGLEATRIIKAGSRSRDIPVIAVTAHAMESEREAAAAAGCDAFVTKPIDESLLLATMKNTLKGRSK